MSDYRTIEFPRTRIPSIDICAVGLQKHHIPALLEADVTRIREKIRQAKSDGRRLSFTACLLRTIAMTLEKHRQATAFRRGKRRLVVFDDINVSMIVEKDVNGHKVPVPLVIERAHAKSAAEMTQLLDDARTKPFSDGDIVLHRQSRAWEKLYYLLPAFLRRAFWRYLLARPHLAYRKMGNVALTSVGMMGNADGWFIPVAVHPVCFGIGNITRKPVLVDGKTELREMLKLTVLLDHDVMDGAPMARFVSDLSANIAAAAGLD